VDSGLHAAGDVLQSLLALPAAGTTLTVESRNGAAVLVMLPPGGFAAYA
jgi:hypothetical protein